MSLRGYCHRNHYPETSSNQYGGVNMLKVNGLSVAQRIALNALVEGRSTQEAAEEAGKSRGTVSRWINHDSDFQTALESRVERVAA